VLARKREQSKHLLLSFLSFEGILVRDLAPLPRASPMCRICALCSFSKPCWNYGILSAMVHPRASHALNRWQPDAHQLVCRFLCLGHMAVPK
jgi:hypothetical protein